MAAPVVAGVVALMLQANPKLTPNLVKAILAVHGAGLPSYDALTQGAGFLNTMGAVRPGAVLRDARSRRKMPIQTGLEPHHHLGQPQAAARRHQAGGQRVGAQHVWGASATAKATTSCGARLRHRDCDNIVWGTAAIDADNIVWGTVAATATTSSGARARDGDNIVWGTSRRRGDNIVWGTAARRQHRVGHRRDDADCDNIVWGTLRRRRATTSSGAPRDDGDNIVWGTADATATTSSGARPRDATTSSGAATPAMRSRVFDEVDVPLSVDDCEFESILGPPVPATPCLYHSGRTPFRSPAQLIGGGF